VDWLVQQFPHEQQQRHRGQSHLSLSLSLSIYQNELAEKNLFRV